MNASRKNWFKITVGFILITVAFLVIFFLYGGGYMNTLPEIFAIVLVVSLIMMAGPCIARITNHRYLSRRKGIKICTINSLVLFIIAAIWLVVSIIRSGPCDSASTVCGTDLSWSLLGMAAFLAILYWFVNICFWVNLHDKR